MGFSHNLRPTRAVDPYVSDTNLKDPVIVIGNQSIQRSQVIECTGCGARGAQGGDANPGGSFVLQPRVIVRENTEWDRKNGNPSNLALPSNSNLETISPEFGV